MRRLDGAVAGGDAAAAAARTRSGRQAPARGREGACGPRAAGSHDASQDVEGRRRGASGGRRGRGGRRACARGREPRHHAAGPSGSRAQHARASGTRARRASTRAAGSRAAGIRRSLGLPEVQLGQGRQPVGRRNRGDRWGAGITRAAGGRTAEEVGRARQGGGQREAAGRPAAACAGSLTRGAEACGGAPGGGREEAARAGSSALPPRSGSRWLVEDEWGKFLVGPTGQ